MTLENVLNTHMTSNIDDPISNTPIKPSFLKKEKGSRGFFERDRNSFLKDLHHFHEIRG